MKVVNIRNYQISYKRDLGPLLDVADASPVLNGDTHVTFLTPTGRPAVSHDPVVLPTFWAPAHHISDVVRGICSAANITTCEDTRLVIIERIVFTVDSNWNNSVLQRLFHGVGVLWAQLMVTLGLNWGFLLWVVAVAIVRWAYACVTPVFFYHSVLALVQIEHLTGVTTTAACWKAVEALLFWKLVESAVIDGPSGLCSRNSREDVAGAARSLVLDSIDLTRGSPVNFSNCWDLIKNLIILVTRFNFFTWH